MLRYLTSGESHGKCLMGILEGMPSGLTIDEDKINDDLRRRQGGYGRGGRQAIETDTIDITGGVLRGIATGAPIGLIVWHKDFKINEMPELASPRPGHADLVGSLKYNEGIRPILERASARSTAMRVAIGALAKQLNEVFGIEILSHVTRVGSVALEKALTFDEIKKGIAGSQVGCADRAVDGQMVAHIDEATQKEDTLGGVIEIRCKGLPVGLGSHVFPDRKLDGRIAGAIMATQAIKAVCFGMGADVARHFGSEVHDEIAYDESRGYYRKSNNAGGLEGGMTTGEELVIHVAKKPIATLKKPLQSVDMTTKEVAEASFERSDTCAITACGVIMEAVVAFEIAVALREKFGGDSIAEMKRNFDAYQAQVKGL